MTIGTKEATEAHFAGRPVSGRVIASTATPERTDQLDEGVYRIAGTADFYFRVGGAAVAIDKTSSTTADNDTCVQSSTQVDRIVLEGDKRYVQIERVSGDGVVTITRLGK